MKFFRLGLAALLTLAASPCAMAQTATPAPATSLPPAYAAMNQADRTALQMDLIWTGDFNGLADGQITERSLAAVKAFQKRSNTKETGVLEPAERKALATAAAAKQAAVGWRMTDDSATTMRIGLPARIAVQPTRGKYGTIWASPSLNVIVETFRMTNTTLAAASEAMEKTSPSRKVTYRAMRPDFFVLSGTQDDKKFYVRGVTRNGEVRGINFSYDKSLEKTMDPVAIAMASAMQPFGPNVAPTPPQNVVYGTGVFVSADGAILTARASVEGCKFIVIPGRGNAEREGNEPGPLALLRVYGASDLPAVAISAKPGTGDAEIKMVGIADPKLQDGKSAAGVAAGRVSDIGVISPAPQAGYAGALVLNAQGQPAGLVSLQNATLAGPATATATASVIPAETISAFLTRHKVAPASGAAKPEAAVTRVICVRR